MPEPEPGVDDKLKALEAAGHPVVRFAMNDEYDLGEQFYLWEIAVAAAGSILRIDAFDQPNVQESKDNTVALLEQYAKERSSFDEPPADVAKGSDFDVTYLVRQPRRSRPDAGDGAGWIVRASCKDGDYNAITAYIARNERHEELLRDCAEDPRCAQGCDHRRIRTALSPLDRSIA